LFVDQLTGDHHLLGVHGQQIPFLLDQFDETSFWPTSL
jgi:hypothetical protein